MREVTIHFTIADVDTFPIEYDDEDAMDWARERVHEKLKQDGVNAYDFVCTIKEKVMEEE